MLPPTKLMCCLTWYLVAPPCPLYAAVLRCGWQVMNKWMQLFFMYLDRYYVKHHSLPPLKKAGLKHFKAYIFDDVKVDVANAMLALVNSVSSPPFSYLSPPPPRPPRPPPPPPPPFAFSPPLLIMSLLPLTVLNQLTLFRSATAP